MAIRNAVRQQSDGDCHLEEAEGAGPQRERQRDVDDEEDQRGGRDRLVDLERSHGEVHGEELRRPAKQLEEAGRQRRARRMEHAHPLQRLMHQPPYSPEPVQRAMTLAPLAQGNRDSGEQKRGSDADHDLDGGQGPPRDTRSRDDVRHEADRRNHVEKPVSKDRAENRGQGVAVSRNVTRQHAHAGHLADTSGKDGVAQQTHAEGSEDVPMAWMRGRKRLVENDVPGDRPYLHGEEIHPDRGGDPLPSHLRESPPDDVEIRNAPDQDADDDRAGCEQKADPAAAGVEDSLGHAPAAPVKAGALVSEP